VLKELLPDAKLIAMLWNKPSKGSALTFRESELASRQLGLALKDLGVSTRDELKGAVRSAAQAGAAALMVIDDTVIASYQSEVVALAAHSRLPIFSQYSEYVHGGGLLSYGPSLPAIYRRGAYYVDRILKGAKPSDLPVEQPVQFELVINLKTAKALGLTVPPTLLARADEVIE
jgi:putative ABC transport system substrate-binding protein